MTERADLENLIEDLVTANHILYHEGVVDGFGHVSVRHPARPDRFLLSRSIAPATVRAEDLMELWKMRAAQTRG
jgi:ribulose-5-phosphate 4-epimerase/fuculose-1-phosphate aldolase